MSKFIVADDSKTMLRIICNTLHRIGIEEKDICTAENGKEAMEHFNSIGVSNITAILTDWNMPVATGLDLVKQVRKINKEIPIIMITTEGGKREVITAIKAGVDNYIIKPFTPDILRSKLQDIEVFNTKES